MKKASFLLIGAATLLAGCSGEIEFRDAEISSGLFYEVEGKEPFSGSVNNVPLLELPLPMLANLEEFVAKAVGTRDFQQHDSKILAGDLGVLCKVDVEKGRLNGPALCEVTSTRNKIFEFTYKDNKPAGDLEIYSTMHESKLLAQAVLVDGWPQGEVKVYHPETGKMVGTAHYEGSGLNGPMQIFDANTGNLLSESEMVNSERHGEFVAYGPDGVTVVKRTIYEKGVDVQARAAKQAAKEAQAHALVASGQYSDYREARGDVETWHWCLDNSQSSYRAQHGDAEPTADIVAGWERNCETLRPQGRNLPPRVVIANPSAEPAAIAVDSQRSNTGDLQPEPASTVQARSSSEMPPAMEQPKARAKPSFDCATAVGAVPQMICESHELAATDVRMAKAYLAALTCTADKERLERLQRGWIKGRDVCTNETCVTSLTSDRAIELDEVCTSGG